MTLEFILEWLDKLEHDWKAPPLDYCTVMESNVTYEVLDICQYPVPVGYGRYGMEALSDCGELATKWVWWMEYDKGMYVCEKHFQDLERMEKREDEKVGTND